MDAIEPNIGALVLFAATWLVCCAGAIQISGLLPLTNAPVEVRSGGGAILLFVNIALLLVVTALSLFYCFRELRWPSIVVAGGIVFLCSPFVTQDLPETLKSGRTGLSLLALVLLIALATLLDAGALDFVYLAFSKP